MSSLLASTDPCCESKAEELAALRVRQSRVLWIVLFVNAGMFVVEFWAGLVAGSTALMADSLDMLGDSFVYGFSLLVLNRSLVWRARAALAKGAIMAAFGVGVLVQAGLSVGAGIPPLAPAMMAIGMRRCCWRCCCSCSCWCRWSC